MINPEKILKLRIDAGYWNERQKSYILSYPKIVKFFEQIKKFDEEKFVCCAHIVYGWMPRVLTLYGDIENGAKLLTKAKKEGSLKNEEIDDLKKIVNNSLVGASKLLHFTAPDKFPIWDSKIYAYVFEEKSNQNRISDISKYRKYIALLEEIKKPKKPKKPKNSENFKSFYNAVTQELYSFYEAANRESDCKVKVSEYRAIELAMFLDAASISD